MRAQKAGEMGWLEPHEFQQQKIQNPSIGEEQTLALITVGHHSAGKQFGRKGPGGWGGHKVEHDPATCLIHNKAIPGCTNILLPKFW